MCTCLYVSVSGGARNEALTSLLWVQLFCEATTSLSWCWQFVCVCVCVHVHFPYAFHVALHRVLLTARAGWRDWLQIMIKLKVFLIVCRQIPRVKRSMAQLLALRYLSHIHTHTHLSLTALHCFALTSTVTFAPPLYQCVCSCPQSTGRVVRAGSLVWHS